MGLFGSSMSIKLSTFNCRGLQDQFKRKKVFHYLKNIGSDILFLQETHCSDKDEQFWKTQWGEHAWFANGSSNSRGVAILLRKTIPIKFCSMYKDSAGRYLILSLKINDIPIVLTNVYGPNNDDPNFFLDMFTQIDKFDAFNLVIAGDFNAVLGPLDYQGSQPHHSNKKSKEIISILMDEFNLIDVWRHFNPNLKQYTRHQANPKVLSRLDFILVSSNFLNNCISSKILPGVSSDHSVVTCDIKLDESPRGRGYWKLNVHYLQYDSDFITYVKEKINDFKEYHKNSICNANIIWDAFKCTISGHCMEYCTRKKKERNVKKSKIIDEISQIDIQIGNRPTDNTLIDKRATLEAELNKILDFETSGIIIRSRCRWAEEGEKSSKYFCNLEKRSCERKKIYRLRQRSGALINNNDDIMKEIHSFYSQLYSEHRTDVNFDTFLNDIEIPKLSDENKEILDQPITKNELYKTLVSMSKNKTPGFDGLPVEFYIVFWMDISDMLVDSYNFSLRNGLLTQSQRNGVITLLPKKDKDPLDVKNYRPITLLSVDYKIITKTLANRMKGVMNDLIQPDQSGFLKGRNIANNIRLTMDIIDYTESNNIAGAILLLDIEKAFDSVNHSFMLEVLKRFNFGTEFLKWVKIFYTDRKNYVINNGFLTDRISMQRGIFQGCPISPYLFLFAMETVALAVKQNTNIFGIFIEDIELKISMFADDTTCFIDGSDDSFTNLFATFDKFAECSGCKINMSKSEAIWIGSKRGSNLFPFRNSGLTWNLTTFKSLGITFHLNLKSMFDLNYKVKLKQIEQTLNCWRARNLSLLGKICVIKTLLLPQLLYQFSVLSIRIPNSFFDTLNKLFFKFIWNGGNDRVKRKIMCSDYSRCGLRMVDPLSYALAQKMVWVNHLLDDNYSSIWKTIEINALLKFHPDMEIIWKSNIPESLLSKIDNNQIADSIRTWYIYRYKAAKYLWDFEIDDYSSQESLWFNKCIRSKSKQFFIYQDWYNKGILTIADILNVSNLDINVKSFEDLVEEFGIPSTDRRKYKFLIKNIPSNWIEIPSFQDSNIFECIVDALNMATKVSKTPKYSYPILLGKCSPNKAKTFWGDSFDEAKLDDDEWEEIHLRNFKCTIESRFRSFYFKIFHKAIGFKDFLYKIKRVDSPNCSFCNKVPETLIHIFCDCEVVVPLWKEILTILRSKYDPNLSFSKFEKIFGIDKDSLVTFIILCTKYYIYRCKFQDKRPSVTALKAFIKMQRETEYHIAKKKGKLSLHYKKWFITI